MKISQPTIPETGFCRVQQILSVFPIGKSTWWKGVKEGKFPQPVTPSPFGASVTVWRCEDIHALIEKAGGAH